MILACIREKLLRGCQLEKYWMGMACGTHEIKCVNISMFEKNLKVINSTPSGYKGVNGRILLKQILRAMWCEGL
jgi:hypothetical protein